MLGTYFGEEHIAVKLVFDGAADEETSGITSLFLALIDSFKCWELCTVRVPAEHALRSKQPVTGILFVFICLESIGCSGDH